MLDFKMFLSTLTLLMFSDRSEFLPEVAKDFIETDADIFWAQLGLESQEAADILQAAGRDKIVMNKCIKIEYQGL